MTVVDRGFRERGRRRRRRDVPATLSLALGGSAGFGAFTPGRGARTTRRASAATVISTAGDAALTVADPATASAGRLVNGAFSLAQPVQAAVTGAFAPVGGSPLTLTPTAGRSATTR